MPGANFAVPFRAVLLTLCVCWGLFTWFSVPVFLSSTNLPWIIFHFVTFLKKYTETEVPCCLPKEADFDNVSRNCEGGTKGSFQTERFAGTKKDVVNHVCMVFRGVLCVGSYETQGDESLLLNL